MTLTGTSLTCTITVGNGSPVVTHTTLAAARTGGVGIYAHAVALNATDFIVYSTP